MSRNSTWLLLLLSLLVTLILGCYGYVYMVEVRTGKLEVAVASHLVKEERVLALLEEQIPTLVEQVRSLHIRLDRQKGGR